MFFIFFMTSSQITLMYVNISADVPWIFLRFCSFSCKVIRETSSSSWKATETSEGKFLQLFWMFLFSSGSVTNHQDGLVRLDFAFAVVLLRNQGGFHSPCSPAEPLPSANTRGFCAAWTTDTPRRWAVCRPNRRASASPRAGCSLTRPLSFASWLVEEPRRRFSEPGWRSDWTWIPFSCRWDTLVPSCPSTASDRPGRSCGCTAAEPGLWRCHSTRDTSGPPPGATWSTACGVLFLNLPNPRLRRSSSVGSCCCTDCSSIVPDQESLMRLAFLCVTSVGVTSVVQQHEKH